MRFSMFRGLKKALKSPGKIKYRSASNNIYHCCAHKTASQWVRRILADENTYLYSGMSYLNPEENKKGEVDTRKVEEKFFLEPFPEKTILSPLYISYESFSKIPKPPFYKAFYVLRDPRDIVCSYYFSIKFSHSRSEGWTE